MNTPAPFEMLRTHIDTTRHPSKQASPSMTFAELSDWHQRQHRYWWCNHLHS